MMLGGHMDGLLLGYLFIDHVMGSNLSKNWTLYGSWMHVAPTCMGIGFEIYPMITTCVPTHLGIKLRTMHG
jgi:hypothetical protein